MLLGLISDTHDQVQATRTAAETFRRLGVEIVLHTGDVKRPGILHLLSDFDLWLALGNGDRDPQLVATAAELFGPGRADDYHLLTFEGKTIAMLHGHHTRFLKELTTGGAYDYVIHGHTHIPRDKRIGRTRVLNPGALGGRNYVGRSYATLDLTSGEFTLYTL
jgi:putative phosphoesterase